jgi:geranylgeranyl pyrophosphate synthase
MFVAIKDNLELTMPAAARPRTITQILEPIQEQLRAVESHLRDVTGVQHPALSAAIEHIVDSGGKRVRPALALLTTGVLQANWQSAIKFGAAIEMLHTATLVHDDLIDGALLRRGIPTLNANWTPAATILTGDYIFARAASLAAQTGSVQVMDLFAQTLMVIVNGELQQQFTSKSSLSRTDYYQRIYAKTASLFELATTGAARLGRPTRH